MRIQHNIMAMNSYRNYTGNSKSLSKNLEKLSSGYKINRAGDDAAGLAISEKMRAQITGLEAAQKNAEDGISLVQTAEGALTEVHSMLNRMVDLADQSANGTYDNGVDRTNLQKEVSALKSEIDRIADGSNFNGIKLLDGDRAAYTVSGNTPAQEMAGAFLSGGKLTNGDSVQVTLNANNSFTVNVTDSDGKTIKFAFDNADPSEGGMFTASVDLSGVAAADLEAVQERWGGVTLSIVVEKGNKADGTFTGGSITLAAGTQATGKGAMTLQVGDTSADFNQMDVAIGDMHAKALGLENIDISTQKGAQKAVDKIRNAINLVSATRGDLGAVQNRLDHTINNLSTMTENVQDAEANIRDVDVAEEMMSYTKNNILVQSAQAMLAQANQAPQGVLQLLQ